MTSPTSTDTFLALLRKSNLLAERQLADYLKRSPALPTDPQGAASQMVSAGLITSFQAEQLLAGRYKGFFLHTGQYKVLRPIGRGGMGTVFLCEHLQLDRQVAIKVLPRKRAQDQTVLDRFQREARAAAALDHPNIVGVHDVNVSAGLAMLVMEYAEGKNLQEVLEQEGRIPYPRAVGYILQAAAGLQHAHERNIIHRDIKPANLLLDRSGIVKILDMGLARFVDKEDGLTHQSGSGVFLGTVDFMAPEQAMPGKPVDSRADLYSLGATLYTLITGNTPFQGSPSQKLMAHQMRDPVAPHEVCPEVPRELSAVICRMMAKKPTNRYATAAEVHAALTPFARGGPENPSATHRLAGRFAKFQSRQARLIAAAVAAVLAVVTLGAGWSLVRRPARASTVQAAAVLPSNPPATVPVPPTPAVPRDQPVAPAVTGQPTEKELYRLKLQMQEPFLSRIEKREHSSATPFPDSWSGHCWKEESVAEVLAERVGDSMALGFRNLSGDPTCQLCTNLSGALGNLEKGRHYVLRVEYQGQKDADATVYVRRSDGMHIVFGKLRPTEGRWEVLDVMIDEEADQARDLAFCTAANGPQTTVFIRSVVLIERPEKDAR
jgi:tRNA A-37 threonylcarbamoyl transferase component Bud32